MRTYPNLPAEIVKGLPFAPKEVNAACRKCSVPKADWFAVWVYMNTSRCLTREFRRKVDHEFGYRLAVLVITKLLRFA
jgi:hypothetical protein